MFSLPLCLFIVIALTACGDINCGTYVGGFRLNKECETQGSTTINRNATTGNVRVERGSLRDDMNCGVCGYSQVLMNHSASSFVGQFTKSRTDSEGKWDAASWTIDYSLGPGEERFLGCTRSPKELHGSCVLGYDYGVVTEKRAYLDMGILDNRKFARVQSIGQACSEICQDPQSPYCYEAKSFSEEWLMESIESAYQLLLRNDVIQSVTLRNIFRVEADPCERSEVLLVGGELMNFGKSCELSSQIEFIGDELEITVSIPEVLRGKVSRQNGLFEVNFNGDGYSPVLNFSDEGLQSDWGGVISSIHAARWRMYAQTSGGCLLVNYVDNGI